MAAIAHELILVEQRMIPVGLHVLGKTPSTDELVDLLALVASFYHVSGPGRGQHSSLVTLAQLIAAGLGWNYAHIQASPKNDADAQAQWERIDRLVTLRTL